MGNDHPGEDLLLDLHAGDLAPPEAQRVWTHLESCRDCARLFAEIVAVEGLASDVLSRRDDARAGPARRIKGVWIAAAAVLLLALGALLALELLSPGDGPVRAKLQLLLDPNFSSVSLWNGDQEVPVGADEWVTELRVLKGSILGVVTDGPHRGEVILCTPEQDGTWKPGECVIARVGSTTEIRDGLRIASNLLKRGELMAGRPDKDLVAVYPRNLVLHRRPPVFVWNRGAVDGPFSLTIRGRASETIEVGDSDYVRLERQVALEPLISYRWTIGSTGGKLAEGGFRFADDERTRAALSALASVKDTPFSDEGARRLVRASLILSVDSSFFLDAAIELTPIEGSSPLAEESRRLRDRLLAEVGLDESTVDAVADLLREQILGNEGS